MEGYDLNFHHYSDDFCRNSDNECHNWFNCQDQINQQFKISKLDMDSFPIEDIQVVKQAQQPTGDSLLDALENSYNHQQPISSEIEIVSSSPFQEQQNIGTLKNNEITTKRVTFETSALIKRSQAEKGDRFQTKNLCKHLHTQTSKFLKNRFVVHQLNKDQVEQIKKFCQSSISIKSFKTLFENEGLSTLCRKFYESTYLVKQIMCSKMEMKSKLTAIKYLQKIISLTYDKEIKAWKKDSKDPF